MTELDQYLKSPRIKDVKDPLKWWYENRGLYPRLSRMARDFLMIPGDFFFVFTAYVSKIIIFRFFRCCRKGFQQGAAHNISCSESFVSPIDARFNVSRILE